MKRGWQMYKELVGLAVPILIGQVGMIVVGFADNIMVGRYSTDALASASFVNTVFNVVILGVLGFSYGLTPLVGALFSKSEKREIGTLMRSALRINCVVTFAMMGLMTGLYFFLDSLGQPEHLLPTIRPYYLLTLGCSIPIMLFNVFAQWSYAINNTRMPMWIILSTNLLNVVGNYTLIYGHFGLPEWGLTGAGVSTLLSRIVAAVAIMWVFFGSCKYSEYVSGFRLKKIWKSHNKKIFKTSYPISIQMMCETGSFSLAGIMAGWMGHIELAALQVIIIVGTLGFCIYYSFGASVTVKVSNAAGRGDREEMRNYAWRGYHVMLTLMTLSSLIFIFLGEPLMGIFSEDSRVVTMATSLIFPLVLYQLGDATQINFANALRGTSHVKPMSWIAFVSYVLVGIPATYVMTFTLGMGMTGLVGSFSVSLFLAGILFLTFFMRATRKESK